MAERMMTYEEAAIALGRTPEAVRQLCKRKHLRRTIGNDGKARIAIPEEMIEEAAGRPAPERPGADHPVRPGADLGPTSTHERDATTLPLDVPATPSEDARALISHLESRVTEMVGELREARARVDDLHAEANAGRKTISEQAASLARFEAELAAERRRAAELEARAQEMKAERDKLLDRALAPAPAGFMARLKRALAV